MPDAIFAVAASLPFQYGGFVNRVNWTLVTISKNYMIKRLVSARFIDASMYRKFAIPFHAIHIAIHFARIAILSANRTICRDDIHSALALTAARHVMHKLVCQC